MATFVATLLKIDPESNPEEANVPIEAGTLAQAQKQAVALIKEKPAGLGWRSYRDAELWGKEQRVLVDVLPADEFEQRNGQGNTRGSEGQDAHEERLRKAAKV